MPKFIRGEGAPQAKLMIVCDAPSPTDSQNGKLLSGQSAEILEEFLAAAGMPISKCYVTATRKYTPINPYKWEALSPGEPSLDRQMEILQEEIRAIEPNCILALGEQALLKLTGKKGLANWRGSILTTMEGHPKVVATYNPNQLTRSQDEGFGQVPKYSYKYVIQLDVQRAVDEARTSNLRLPDRALSVCKSSIELQRFIERSDKSAPLSVDIESSRCIPICIGLSFHRGEAISIPLFNRLSHINYTGIPASELAYIWKDIAEVLHDRNLIGQNFKFDEDKLFRLGFSCNLWGDTMLLAHTINPEMPRKSLGFLASIYTRERYWKDEGKEFDPKKDKFDQLLLYNAKDAAVTHEVHEEMLKEADELGLKEYYFRAMMPRHKFYLNMERVGFRMDYAVRERLLHKYLDMYEEVHSSTSRALGRPLNVASSPQVTQALYGDLKLPKRFQRKKHPLEAPRLNADEDTITALLANQAKTEQQKLILNNILKERKIRKTVSTYVLANPDYDGRMRTSYNITGAETDRTSTSNISAPIRPEKSIGLGFQTLTKHGDIGDDICEMFVPDPGKVFINADLSQAEARVVFVLAEEFELLKRLEDPRFDMHWQTALWIFDELPRTAEECKATLDKEDPRRFIGKTVRHAGHLGAKKRMLMQTVNTDAKKYHIDLFVSEWRAGTYLDKFHANAPNIRSVFHAGVEHALSTTRILRGPTLIGADNHPLPCGRYRMFFDRWSDELLKEAFAEIPQHTVSNQTKFAGMRIKKRLPKLQFILEGHDALLVQCAPNEVKEVAQVMKEEMEKPIDFRSCSMSRDYQLVIPADFQIGEINYKDLRKYKL